MTAHFLKLTLLLLALGLGGCALSGGKPEGSTAKTRAALEVPPDLARPASAEDPMAAPVTGGGTVYSDYARNREATTTHAAAPAADATNKNVRLERAGAMRWLVVTASPGQVWTRTREYFQVNNIKIAVENPQAGQLESDWTERPYPAGDGVLSKLFGKLHSTGLKDKYRVRIEPGREPGTSEVYVSHLALEEVVVSPSGASFVQTTWQPHASDPALEADLLARLMKQYGGGEAQAKAALADAERAQLSKDKDAVLLPQEALDSAWRRVGQALDRAGVVIEDRDRSAGLFYIRFLEKVKETGSGGLLDWLASDKTISTKDERPSDRFQIRVQANGSGSRVTVLDIKGQPDSSKAAARLLELLQIYLR